MKAGIFHRLILVFVATASGFTGTVANAQSGELAAAAKRGDLAAVNALLKSGADVNDRKFTVTNFATGDSTALMEASFYGRLDVVQALLAAKADVNATLLEKKDGTTALMLATHNGHVEVVRALLAAKADVNHSCCGASAVYDATRAGNLEMVRVLLTAKPDLNVGNKTNGETALIRALSSGRSDIALLLAEAGADVNAWSKRIGLMPLMFVIRQNNQKTLAMVQAFLAAGANVDYRNCFSDYDGRAPVGNTALGLASALGRADVVQALLAAKADVNLKHCDGKTPLMLALENNRADVAELLRSAGATAPAEK